MQILYYDTLVIYIHNFLNTFWHLLNILISHGNCRKWESKRKFIYMEFHFHNRGYVEHSCVKISCDTAHFTVSNFTCSHKFTWSAGFKKIITFTIIPQTRTHKVYYLQYSPCLCGMYHYVWKYLDTWCTTF